MKSFILIASLSLIHLSHKTYGQTNSLTSQTQLNKTSKMKEFSLLVRVPITYTPEQAKALNPKWNVLLDKWKADSIYIISFAFPGESYIVAGAEKNAKKESVICDNLRVVSNLFIRAINIEEAVELAKSVPILEFGGTIEVREIPQRPATPQNKK